MVLHPKVLLDQLRHSIKGPEVGLISRHFGSSLKPLFKALKLRLAQPRFAPGAARLPKSFSSLLLDCLSPAIDRLAVRSHLPRYLCFAHSLTSQSESLKPPTLPSIDISLPSCWISHAGLSITD